MKKLVYCLFLSLLVFSCKDDEKTDPESEVDTTPPGKITHLAARPGYGDVTLKWRRPADEDYGYTSIGFTRNGEMFSLQSRDSITIEGFEDTQSYEFSLTATDKNQNKAEAVKITAAPKEPTCLVVSPTVKVESVTGGARISWTNITGKVVTVTVDYTDKDGNAQMAQKISTKADDYLDIVFVMTVKQTVKVSVSSGNLQLPFKDFLLPASVDKSIWEVIGFSSQEETGENAGNNGRAIHAIDGNYSTYWHTIWSGGSPTLPNYLVFDMKKTSELNWLKVVQRSGSTSLNTVEILMGSDVDNLTKVGTLTFPNSAGGSQEINFTDPPQGHYLKLNMPDSRHSGKHSMIAEIEVKGIIIEEDVE